MNFRQQLEGFEGRKHTAYRCTQGVWTIGVGHTGPEVHEGLVWTDAQIDDAFDIDIEEALDACDRNFPWFPRLNEPRRAVVAGMAFQMGMTKLLKFKATLAAIRDERWANAAEGMRNSLWARQTPKRVNRLARQMETGEWN